MRLHLFTLVAWIGPLVLFASASEPSDVWQPDYARAAAEARQTGRMLLIHFYADWCGPCRMIAPVLDELASARAGELLVLKLDTDRYGEIAQRFEVRGIPTLIVFRDGREAGRHVGLAGRPELEALLGR